jgi:hypothetical protein
MLFYRAALPLSSRTLTFVSGVIPRHRAAMGSPWRKAERGRQALLVLVYLRKGEMYAELAAGFGVVPPRRRTSARPPGRRRRKGTPTLSSMAP